MAKPFERMTRGELIAALRSLQEERAELQCYREEVRIQTEQLLDAQRSLERARDRYADLYDFAPLPYMTLSSTGIIEEINLTGAGLLGSERSFILGKPLLNYIEEYDRKLFLDHMLRCRAGASFVVTALDLRARRGTVPVQLSTVRTSGDKTTQFLYRTAITDLSERKRAEQEIRRLNAELEERVRQRTGELEAANRRLEDEILHRRQAEERLKEYTAALESTNESLREAYEAAKEANEAKLEGERAARAEAERIGVMKDEFLATLSHELRTPLNAMIGWTQLIRGGTLSDAENSHALDTIERNVRIQTQLIEDLLDMSRIISGKFSLELAPVQMARLVESAVDAVRPQCDAKQIRVTVRLDAEDAVVRGDPGRLQQALYNLLSNSIKFSGPGGEVTVEQAACDGTAIEIRVSDTGEGIAPEFLPYVFDRFRQADTSSVRRHGGLGLGLSIVRYVVEAHGGTIEARSEGIGKGASFVMRFPVDSREEAERPPFDSAAEPIQRVASTLRGIRVLVVDDDPGTCELVKRYLESAEAAVVAAGSASEALDRFQKSPPDVLVCDISMPDVDGYELLQRMRRIEFPRRTPAVALTAYARAEDRRKALEAGFALHLAKPGGLLHLAAALAKLIAGPARPEAGRRRILVVDDDRDSAGCTATVLQLEGHDVRIAHDGKTAVELAAGMRPDLVLVDVVLPDMSGAEVAKHLRGLPQASGARIGALTGYEENHRKVRQGRFDFYLKKPVDLETLKSVLT